MRWIRPKSKIYFRRHCFLRELIFSIFFWQICFVVSFRFRRCDKHEYEAKEEKLQTQLGKWFLNIINARTVVWSENAILPKLWVLSLCFFLFFCWWRVMLFCWEREKNLYILFRIFLIPVRPVSFFCFFLFYLEHRKTRFIWLFIVFVTCEHANPK